MKFFFGSEFGVCLMTRHITSRTFVFALFLSVLSCQIFESPAKAQVVIGSEDFDGGEVNLVSGFDPIFNVTILPHTRYGVFKNDDWSAGNCAPFSLADDSSEDVSTNGDGIPWGKDYEGVVGSARDKQDSYFVLADASDFTIGFVEESWVFDVAAAQGPITLQIDMGQQCNDAFDGVSSLNFVEFEYRFDNQPFSTAFSVSATELVGRGFNYRAMDNGNIATIDFFGNGTHMGCEIGNPGVTKITPGGTVASNTILDKSVPSSGELDTYSIDLSGTGSTLEIRMTGNFGFNAFVFDNITILSEGAGGIAGDVNSDESINLLDICPFVDLLNTGGFDPNADINSDGVVDTADVAPFVNLIRTNCSGDGLSNASTGGTGDFFWSTQNLNSGAENSPLLLDLDIGETRTIYLYYTTNGPTDSEIKIGGTLDLLPSTPGIIKFANAETLDFDITQGGNMVGRRWANADGSGGFAGAAQTITSDSIDCLSAFTVTAGTGILEQNTGQPMMDEGYDADADAFLIGSVEVCGVGPGTINLNVEDLAIVNDCLPTDVTFCPATITVLLPPSALFGDFFFSFTEDGANEGQEMEFVTGDTGSLFVYWSTNGPENSELDQGAFIDVLTDRAGVIEFTAAETFDFEITDAGTPVDNRWLDENGLDGFVGPAESIAANFIDELAAFTVLNGPGIVEANNGSGSLLDAGYNLNNDGFLWGRIDFNVVGQGTVNITGFPGSGSIVNNGSSVDATFTTATVKVLPGKTNWISADGGSWNAPENWSNGLPGTPSDACFGLPDSGSVTLAESAVIAELLVDDSLGANVSFDFGPNTLTVTDQIGVGTFDTATITQNSGKLVTPQLNFGLFSTASFGTYKLNDGTLEAETVLFGFNPNNQFLLQGGRLIAENVGQGMGAFLWQDGTLSIEIFTRPLLSQQAGSLSPGNPLGISRLNNWQANGGMLEIEIAGTFDGGGQTALTEFDWVRVNNIVELNNIQLNVSLINGFQLQPDQSFEIVDVFGGSVGQFSGLPEGSIVGEFNGLDLVISYQGGDGNDIVLTSQTQVLLGDVNLDGMINLLDVDFFIDRLSTGTYQAEADCNQDGAINLLDIDPFIEILGGG